MKKTMFVVAMVMFLLLNVSANSVLFGTEKPASEAAKPLEQKKIGSDFSVSTTITNKHMWRALPSGDAPCIEPIITWTKGNLAVSAWGCYAVNDSYREIDLYATYDWKYVQVGIYDYYCPEVDAQTNDFTELKNTDTQHFFEAQAVFKGTEKFPVSLTTACFIGGGDIDDNGKQLYSSYMELAYSRKINDNTLTLEVGMTPAKSMYADNASFFNYGFSVGRDMKITDHWNVPSTYKVVYNKESKKIFLSVGFTLG